MCKCGGYVSYDSSKCGAPDYTSKPCTDTSKCVCTWKYSEFGPCSSECGSGVRTRAATACSATTNTGSSVSCSPVHCGTPSLTKPCYSADKCPVECVAHDCRDAADTSVATLVSFAQGTSGTLIGTLDLLTPAFGDLRGLFFDFPSTVGFDPSTCSVNSTPLISAPLTGKEQPSVNLNGCPNKDSHWDLTVALGTPGAGKDDIDELTFTFACTGYSLTPDSLSGTTVGVRVTSLADTEDSREGSAKLTCVLGKKVNHGRRR